jgi:hypothetical protein
MIDWKAKGPKVRGLFQAQEGRFDRVGIAGGYVALASPGHKFYVWPDESSGDTQPGTSWERPLTSIGAALDLCESGRGDVIYVMPGTYDENVVIDKDYVSVIGVQSGYGRPDIVPAAGLALHVDNAHGVVLRSLRFASDGQDADVARIEGNGFLAEDCVFDGDPGMGVTKALLRLWCDVADDSYTASEGIIRDCLFRGSPGKGLVFDCQHATVGVLPTDDVIENCRFLDNTGEDIFLAATAVSVADMKRCRFVGCLIGGGTGKNKATHVDLKTNKIGTANTSTFEGCFVADDTVDTTALKVDATGVSFIGCYNLDGLINGDALD